MIDKWFAEIQRLAISLGLPTRPRMAPAALYHLLEQEHRELTDRRVIFALWFGLLVYPLDMLELWFNFHDASTVAAQTAVEVAIVVLALLTLTAWGRCRRLALFHCGYALVLVANEAIAYYKSAFGSPWADGFDQAFAFYSLLIPVSVRLTAIVGVACMVLMSIPKALLTANPMLGVLSVIHNLELFTILLGARVIANRSWHNEALARYLEADTVNRQVEFNIAVSHELRRSLSVVCSASEQLVSGTISDPEALAVRYRMLVSHSQRLRRRVDGLLEFGLLLLRGEGRTTLVEPEYLDPAGIVQSVVFEFKNTFAAPDHEISVHISPDTPLILGNLSALSSVVWNLLDNAVKYSPEGKTVWVEVGQAESSSTLDASYNLDGKQQPVKQGTVRDVGHHWAFIRVRDLGRGIRSEDVDHIFEKYVRGESARDTEGTGIGLTLVQDLVKAHGGKIWVDSQLGAGSTFTVMLPAVPINKGA